MDLFKGENVIEYQKHFNNDDKCKEYLAQIKWSNGFQCPVCNHDQYYNGHKSHSRVCKKCRRIDSATANTLFHKVKFGLHKAFWIVFEMSCSTKSISSTQVAKRVGITQKTAWLFMQKVRCAMGSSRQFPLEGKVEVDEFVIGSKEKGKQGRSRNSKKKKVVCAVELTQQNKIKRFYALPIADYSADELSVLFDHHISDDAQVTTDKWSAYQVLASQYNIEQILSNQGKNFPQTHIMIASLKSWLRTIPSHVSSKHLKKYLDEFSYRINRSIFKETIFHNLLERMTNHHLTTWKNIVNT